MGEYIRTSERFTESTANMTTSADRLGMTIFNKLEPHLSPLLDRLSNFVDRHDRDIGEVFDRLGKAVEDVDWAQVGRGVENAGRAISFATSNAKLMTDAMELLAANWAFRALFGRGIVGAIAATPAGRAAAITGSLSGDTPGGGSGRRNTPEENAEIERRNAETNSRYGYTGHLLHDLGVWWRGGRPSSRLPGGPGSGFENPSEVLPPSSMAPTSREREERLRVGRNVLMGLGRSRVEAAGIMAGLMNESGLNPGAVGDSGTAFGLAQWHAARRALITSGFGRSPVGASFEDQIRMVDWELRNSPDERGANDRLHRAATYHEAGGAFRRYYERPLNADRDASISAATAEALGRRWENDLPHQEPGGTTSDTPQRNPRNLPLHDDPSTWPRPPSDGGNSTVRIDINHTNVPPGVTMTPTIKGDGVELSSVRIGRSMERAGPTNGFNPFGVP